MITDELQKQTEQELYNTAKELMKYLTEVAGLTQQQAQSKGVKATLDFMATEGGKKLPKKLVEQFMNDTTRDLQRIKARYDELDRERQELVHKLDDLGAVTSRIKEEIQKESEEYGLESMDSRAKNAVVLFSTMLNLSRDADVNVSVQSASYCVYAYLGGEASCYIDVADKNKPLKIAGKSYSADKRGAL